MTTPNQTDGSSSRSFRHSFSSLAFTPSASFSRLDSTIKLFFTHPKLWVSHGAQFAGSGQLPAERDRAVWRPGYVYSLATLRPTRSFFMYIRASACANSRKPSVRAAADDSSFIFSIAHPPEDVAHLYLISITECHFYQL